MKIKCSSYSRDKIDFFVCVCMCVLKKIKEETKTVNSATPQIIYLISSSILENKRIHHLK